jgi:hypothetical protein
MRVVDPGVDHGHDHVPTCGEVPRIRRANVGANLAAVLADVTERPLLAEQVVVRQPFGAHEVVRLHVLDGALP